MKNILKISIALAFLFTLSSCWLDKTKPNYQYMPDMYKPVGYETYSVNPNFSDGRTSQQPVEGTIARGKVPYDYADTTEGYDSALVNLKNPLEVNEENLANGKAMFTITEGSIYHVIMYGRNLMGSHASQLTDKERWQVVMYVQQLRNELLK